ncbi:hypothetical protein [uncultured Fibrella sp.]|uniref:hypothetical protein n=1 Tax=uncultured Fibrella sp. TaxID=1284596 RepID=UPI0035CCA228
MKAYNLAWLEERDIRQQADRWQAQHVLTDEQAEAIRQAYPIRFKQTGTALEIGSFVFTLLAALALYGLVSITLDINSRGSGLVSLIMAGGTFAVAVFSIRSNQFYRNGIDNALWLVSALSAVWGLVLVFFQRNDVFPPFWEVCLIALPVLLAYIIYTGDTILTYFGLAAFYGLIFDGLLDISWGQSMLPFALMGASAGLFALVSWLGNSMTNAVYYSDVLTLVQWVSLFIGLAAGNYYVVRELNALLLDGRYAISPEIALPGLFWLTTFVIPLLYGVVGFRQRNRMLLVVAVIGVAGAIATVYHYVGTWPLSVTLAIHGGVVIGLAILLIRYLRMPNYGFTDAIDEEPPLELLRHVGLLTTLQGTANAQNQPTGPRFGGGDFGGGGAGEQY